MKNSINPFYAPIKHKKKKHDFRAWLELIKIKRYIKKTSPSYDMMLTIYEFLIILKNVYMYNVDMGLNLVAGSINDNSYEASIVYDSQTFKIIFLMHQKSATDGKLPLKEIQVELSRKGAGARSKDKVYLNFIDGQPYTYNNIYEEDQLLFIIGTLMNSLSDLITYYYKNKAL